MSPDERTAVTCLMGSIPDLHEARDHLTGAIASLKAGELEEYIESVRNAHKAIGVVDAIVDDNVDLLAGIAHGDSQPNPNVVAPPMGKEART